MQESIQEGRRGRRAGAVFAGAAVFILVLLPFALAAQHAAAHGVELSYSSREGIEIIARFDSGDPMADAQVTVYAPGEPSEPWLTGTCDEAGKFFFVPDPGLPGTWEVQVRQAGHGGLIRIEVEEGSMEAGGSTGFTTLQKVVMSLAVLWGFAGTALYFRRRKA
jgi:nickel transport protein